MIQIQTVALTLCYARILETPRVSFTLVFVSLIESVWQCVGKGGA